MDETEFEQLKAHAKTVGTAKGVSAEVTLVDMQASSFNTAGERIQLRVFRFIPGRQPLEYTNAAGYPVDAPNLQERIDRDIAVAAQKLYESK